MRVEKSLLMAAICCIAALACSTQDTLASPSDREFDVVIIGAGVSGLTAARTLLRANRSVMVLEAQDRIGGRAYRLPVVDSSGIAVPCNNVPECDNAMVNNAYWYDRGGQWVGPGQVNLLEMAEEYGVQRYPSIAQHEGKQRLYVNGAPVLVPYWFLATDEISPEDIPESATPDQRASILEFIRVQAAFAAISETVNISAPWEAPDAKELDSVTYYEWLEAQTEDQWARDMMAMSSWDDGALGGIDPRLVSALHVARQLQSSPTDAQPEKWMFWGAAGQFAELLTEDVELMGGHIVVSSPAYHVKQSDEGVEVDTKTGTYKGKYVILAMPPHLTGKLSYDPPLPSPRQQLVQRTPMGAVVKVISVYSTPFWRQGQYDLGQNDTVTSGQDPTPTAAINIGEDVSPSGEGSPGVIAGFMYAERAFNATAQGTDGVRAAVLPQWSKYFNDDPRIITDPLEFIVANWD